MKVGKIYRYLMGIGRLERFKAIFLASTKCHNLKELLRFQNPANAANLPLRAINLSPRKFLKSSLETAHPYPLGMKSFKKKLKVLWARNLKLKQREGNQKCEPVPNFMAGLKVFWIHLEWRLLFQNLLKS